jgi:hypothetical protein
MNHLRKKLILSVAAIGLLAGSSAYAETITQTIKAQFNSIKLKVNGQSVQADNILYDGTTYVPLRMTAELFGKKVDWNGDSNTANIRDAAPGEQYKIKDITFAEPYEIEYLRNGQSELKAYERRRESDHFQVYYHRDVTDDYAQTVLDEFEKAFRVYIEEMGIAYPLEGKLYIVIEPLSGENVGAAAATIGGSDGKLRFPEKVVMAPNVDRHVLGATIYHEFFHLLQQYYFYKSDSFFMIESVPSAAAYAVQPFGKHLEMDLEAYFTNPDYNISGERNGTVALIIYLHEAYGMSFKRLLEAEAIGYKDTEALRAVLAEKGVTLEEAYARFAAEVYRTNMLKLDSFASIRDRGIVASAAWNGASQTVSQNTKDRFFDRMVKRSGEPLTVNNLFGTDYVEITPQSNATLHLKLSNPNLLLQPIGIRADGSGELLDATIEKPQSYAKIVLAVTKIKNGSGRYSVELN